MRAKCGMRGIKNIEKAQNIENKLYCSKSSDKTVDKGDMKKVKPKEK